MPIDGFDAQGFAQSMAQQAGEFLPQDFDDESKNYVIGKLHSFCQMAGQSLENEPNMTLNAEQASMIVQYIGEWTFHKCIDLIRSNLSNEVRDHIIQQVAFVVFDEAKKAVAENIPHEQVAPTIEAQVDRIFKESIMQLVNSGHIQEQDVEHILSQSNVAQVSQEMAEQAAAEQGSPPSEEEQRRAFKLAAISILLKNMDKKTVQGILSGMSEADADQIMDFMKVPELEHQLDPTLLARELEDFKQSLNIQPDPESIDYSQMIRMLATRVNPNKILSLAKYERPLIREYTAECFTSEVNNMPISKNLSKIIYEYLSLKFNA